MKMNKTQIAIKQGKYELLNKLQNLINGDIDGDDLKMIIWANLARCEGLDTELIRQYPDYIN